MRSLNFLIIFLLLSSCLNCHQATRVEDPLISYSCIGKGQIPVEFPENRRVLFGLTSDQLEVIEEYYDIDVPFPRPLVMLRRETFARESGCLVKVVTNSKTKLRL
jgi:hypothetical protein